MGSSSTLIYTSELILCFIIHHERLGNARHLAEGYKTKILVSICMGAYDKTPLILAELSVSKVELEEITLKNALMSVI